MAIPAYGTGAGECEAILRNIADLTGMANPALKTPQVGYLDFITSEKNRQNLDVNLLTSSTGASVQARVKFMPRTEPGTPNTDRDSIDCTGATCDSPSYSEDLVGIEDDYTFCVQWSDNLFTALCTSSSIYQDAQFMSMRNKALQELNQLLITEQSTNFGINVENSNLTTVFAKTVFAASGQVDASVWTDIEYEIGENEIMLPNVAMIGNKPISKLTTLQNTACCNQDGVNMDEMLNIHGYAPFRDRQVPSILGNADDVIVAEFGSTQLLTYNETNQAKNYGTEIRFKMPDPEFNIDWDVRITRDCNNNSWTARYSLFYKWWVIPAGVYNIGDRLRPTSAAMNGTLFYRFS